MDKFYYFVSSLPFLDFDTSPMTTKEDFLKNVSQWLNRKEFSFLKRAHINDYAPKERLPFLLEEYKKYEYALRRAIVSFRQGRKEKEDIRSQSWIQDALGQLNPLEAEKKLLWLRWERIQALEEGHYFDIEFLIAYFLKLQITERLSFFDKEKGKEKFLEVSSIESEH